MGMATSAPTIRSPGGSSWWCSCAFFNSIQRTFLSSRTSLMFLRVIGSSATSRRRTRRGSSSGMATAVSAPMMIRRGRKRSSSSSRRSLSRFSAVLSTTLRVVSSSSRARTARSFRGSTPALMGASTGHACAPLPTSAATASSSRASSATSPRRWHSSPGPYRLEGRGPTHSTASRSMSPSSQSRTFWTPMSCLSSSPPSSS